MASPSFQDVWQYSRQLQRIAQEAGKELIAALEKIDIEDIDLVKSIVTAIAEKYGLASGELGAQWYEYCKAGKFTSGYTAITGQVSRYGVRSDVDAVMTKYNAGEIDLATATARLGGVAVDQVKKNARDTILGNLNEEYLEARRTGRKDIADMCGYSRVPVGDTCAFCCLLASRGFVYKSERSALYDNYGNKYHDGCDCVAVPLTKASGIPGYGGKLSEYESMYRSADNLRRSGNMPDDLRERIYDAKAKHRADYEAGLTSDRWSTLNEDLIIMRYQNPGMH